MTRTELENRLNIFLIDTSHKWADKEKYGFCNDKEMQQMIILWHLLEYIDDYSSDELDNVFTKAKCV